jgi:hypothetical protein
MRHSGKVAMGLAATSVIAALALPMGQAGATSSPTATGIASVARVTMPNSNIDKSGTKAAVFDPTSLSAGWSSAATPPPACTAGIVAFTITNTTTTTQTVTVGKKVIGHITAGESLGVCTYGSGKARFKFKLKKSSSRLTVRVS